MTETKMPTLAEVDAYEVPSFLAERIAKIHKVPQDFSEGLIKEAKRMLYLCCVSSEAVAPSDRVDWAWHEMLMFTHFYQEFAEFIGSFIHHVPNAPEDEDGEPETWKSIQKTLCVPRRGSETYNTMKANYQKFFGFAPDPLYWP